MWLARLGDAAVGDAVPSGSVQMVHDEATVALPIATVIDIGQEKQRLNKEIAKKNVEIDKSKKKLSNQGFLAKAPAEVVETQRERMAEEERAVGKLEEALERLASIG